MGTGRPDPRRPTQQAPDQVPFSPQVPVAPTAPLPAAAQPVPAAPAQLPNVTLSERDRQVLSYLSEHELVGPTDLVVAFGASGPTWSRVLSSLSAQGLVMKRSQKYQLTAVGRAFA